MTNYFLTTAVKSFLFFPYCSSDIRLCVLHFPSRGNVLLQQNLKHMSPIHFTHVGNYYVFRTWRAWERTCYWRWVKCNCVVIAAVRVRRKAAISRTQDVSKKTSLLSAFPSANTPLPCQSILSCIIVPLLPLAPQRQTHTHIHTVFPNVRKSLFT